MCRASYFAVWHCQTTTVCGTAHIFFSHIYFYTSKQVCETECVCTVLYMRPQVMTVKWCRIGFNGTDGLSVTLIQRSSNRVRTCRKPLNKEWTLPQVLSGWRMTSSDFFFCPSAAPTHIKHNVLKMAAERWGGFLGQRSSVLPRCASLEREQSPNVRLHPSPCRQLYSLSIIL